MRILVDTSVWAGYFDGVVSRQTDYLHRLLGEGFLVTGDLIVAEVLTGYLQPESYAAAKKALLHFTLHQIGTWEIAQLAADHTHRLRAEHHLPAPNLVDSLIAAFCLQWNIALLHSDPAFEPFEDHLGLRPALPRRVG